MHFLCQIHVMTVKTFRITKNLLGLIKKYILCDQCTQLYFSDDSVQGTKVSTFIFSCEIQNTLHLIVKHLYIQDLQHYT